MAPTLSPDTARGALRFFVSEGPPGVALASLGVPGGDAAAVFEVIRGPKGGLDLEGFQIRCAALRDSGKELYECGYVGDSFLSLDRLQWRARTLKRIADKVHEVQGYFGKDHTFGHYLASVAMALRVPRVVIGDSSVMTPAMAIDEVNAFVKQKVA